MSLPLHTQEICKLSLIWVIPQLASPTQRQNSPSQVTPVALSRMAREKEGQLIYLLPLTPDP